MDIVSMLNLGALALGLAAWVLAGVSMFTGRSLTAWSFGLCSLSLLCEMGYTQHLVEIRDWSAMEDTHGAVFFAARTLVVITLALNLLALLLRRKRQAKA